VQNNKKKCLYEEQHNLKTVFLFYHQTTVIFSGWQMYIDKETSVYSFTETTKTFIIWLHLSYFHQEK